MVGFVSCLCCLCWGVVMATTSAQFIHLNVVTVGRNCLSHTLRIWKVWKTPVQYSRTLLYVGVHVLDSDKHSGPTLFYLLKETWPKSNFLYDYIKAPIWVRTPTMSMQCNGCTIINGFQTILWSYCEDIGSDLLQWLKMLSKSHTICFGSWLSTRHNGRKCYPGVLC